MVRSLDPADFRRVLLLNAHAELTGGEAERRAAYAGILDEVAGSVETEADAAAILARVPEAIGRRMAPFGWMWNGFYVLREDGNLHVGPACGPPVCALLERAQGGRDGPLTSGMCFDGLILNQTLVAWSAKDWPGYVSCDATSGLRTVAGIVVPLRDARGRPIAVWDLDASEPVLPGDVRFFDVLFATLARCLALRPASFSSPAVR